MAALDDSEPDDPSLRRISRTIFGQWPVGDAFAVGEAVTVQHRRFYADFAHELLDQARLADPGRPEHRQQMAGSVLLHAREGTPERAQRLLAADEWGSEAAGARGDGQLLGCGQIGSRLGRAEDTLLHQLSFRTRAERPGVAAERPAGMVVAHAGTLALRAPPPAQVVHERYLSTWAGGTRLPQINGRATEPGAGPLAPAWRTAA